MQTRECGDCNMCCKLPEINYFKEKKESYKWCNHCEIGVGCKIYSDRPQGCKDFFCMWQTGVSDLKPNKVGFFIFPENQTAYEEKILTIYSEEPRVHNIPKLLMKDAYWYNLIDQGWAFHIRFNKDDNDLYIFDLKSFGIELKKTRRNQYD